MRTTCARSTSRTVLPLLRGAPREGVGLGHGYVSFDGYVLAITARDRPRMPNGIECDVAVERGERARVGGGALVLGDARVLPGPVWEPIPKPRWPLPRDLHLAPDPLRLSGRGPGLTPAGDDVLIGYAAGLVLFHGRDADACAIASAARPRTTALAATLLEHAARGELPEPAHAFLERGDPLPLVEWGHSSGRWLLLGLLLAAASPPAPTLLERRA